MIGKFQVFLAERETWPARNGKPAGERKQLLLVDMSEPADDRMRSILAYGLSDDEAVKNFGPHMNGKTVTVAMHEITNGFKHPVLRGRLSAVSEK